jgi:hypothetical protein
MSMSPEQLLFQTVIEKAFVDAINPDPANDIDRRAKSEAVAWIANCGRDFRRVCEWAGMDPDFLSDAFNANKINRNTLKNSSKVGRRTQ